MPAEPKGSIFNSLPPKDTPLDWFAPAAFNALPIIERYERAKAGLFVVYPPQEFLTIEKWHLWRKMPYTEFMERWGNDIKKEYNIPTHAEAAEAERRLQGNGEAINDNEELGEEFRIAFADDAMDMNA